MANGTTDEPESSGTLVDRVYEATLTSIIDGTYAPNSRLRVNSVAASNSVSVIPVREALRTLAAQRLIETLPNKGARVAPISVSDLLDSYHVRIVVESDALRLAAPSLSPEDIAALRAMAQKMVERFEADDFESAWKIHKDFHFGLYEAAESPWLSHIIQMLWVYTERFRRLATRLHATSQEIGDNHLAILDRLSEGDYSGAVDALVADLEDTERHVLGALERGDITAVE